MYGGSGVSPAGSPWRRSAPAALAEMLEQLDVAVPPPGAQAASSAGRDASQSAVAERLEQQHLAARALERQARRKHARVVDDDELAGELLRQLGEDAVPHLVPAAVVDEQPRRVAPGRRMLGDQLRGQVVVELVGFHPVSAVLSRRGRPSRARTREGERAVGRSGRAVAPVRPTSTRRSSAPRARSSRSRWRRPSCRRGCPDAIQDGLKEHFRPSARHLAEVRGLMNQVLRRLERLEGDLLAERHARVDDLALLVDLVASGWQSVNERLATIEEKLDQPRLRSVS